MRTLVIEFPQAEDHEWALKQITRQIAKGNGNQLAGGSASILLCALSRAAHVADLGDVPPAIEAQAARIRDLVSENVRLRRTLQLCVARLEEYGDAEGGTALELARKELSNQ
jgi:hypothetical protein